MFDASCHCGNIRLEADAAPDSVTSCNCSICHRLGALWAYYAPGSVRVDEGARGANSYSWGEATIVYYRCANCGCTTHYLSRESDGEPVLAINCRMAAPAAIESIPVRRFDGREAWRYLDEAEPVPAPRKADGARNP